MSKIELDRSDFLKLFPAASNYIEKLSESALQDHEDLLYNRKKLLDEIQQAKPQIFQLIQDCIRFNPADRYYLG